MFWFAGVMLEVSRYVSYSGVAGRRISSMREEICGACLPRKRLLGSNNRLDPMLLNPAIGIVGWRWWQQVEVET